MALRPKSTLKPSEPGRYFELVQEFPLRPLRSSEEYSAALQMVETLISRPNLGSGERDYLAVLTAMIKHYEANECPMPDVSEAEVLRHLIEAQGLTQLKFAAEVGIAMSTVSDVLNGKRRLTRQQVETVSEYFAVPHSVFLETAKTRRPHQAVLSSAAGTRVAPAEKRVLPRPIGEKAKKEHASESGPPVRAARRKA